MNKNIKKNKFHRPDIFSRSKQVREEHPDLRKKVTEKKISNHKEKSVRNRCCLVRPKQQDFGNYAQLEYLIQSENVLSEDNHFLLFPGQYGLESVKHDSSNAMTSVYDMFTKTKTENSFPFKEDIGVNAMEFVETSDGTQWQNIESTQHLDKIIQEENKGPPVKYSAIPQNVHIAEIPKVKIIAEKFSKYQRGNVELRRLDEKIVCVEYDIFDRKSTSTMKKPVQYMRVFFSIKPLYGQDGTEETPLSILPPKIKDQFNLDEDFNHLTENEVEIIDEMIPENKSYLEDLQNVVKRMDHERVKKDRSSLDLNYLYNMAKREWRMESNISVTNYLSLKELKEVKNLILQKCASSVHGISRKLLKTEAKLGSGILTGSILAGLFTDDGTKCL